ncbi:MAG: sensor histidine kinase, partial [Acidimicrobiales bacterium]
TRDVDALKLLAGDSTTGFSGNESFAAAPVILPLDVQTGLAPGERLAVVFTRSVGGLESSWVYLILVGGATLIIAAAVGAELSRRITRPLVEASDATARMAGGELSARVQVGRWEAPEIVLLSESINTLAAGLEATRERESQLLLSVSHDLRTPLTSIRGYAEAVEEGVSDDPVASAAVIGREARRLERLVADLLDLAKLRADHLSLDLVDIDVARVVDDVVSAQQPAAGDRGVALDFEGSSLDGRVPFVQADPDRLAQVVSNLVENAISFATSRVTVSLRPLERPSPPGSDGDGAVAGSPGSGAPISCACRITVEDDGPGIASEELPLVFDRFYQGDRGSAARTGSGLGLSIVSELLKAMGGDVEAVSPAGPKGGTRMVVELPARP